jgi:hypothetical protein
VNTRTSFGASRKMKKYMHDCDWLFASRITNIKGNKQVAFLGEANIE